MKKIILLGFLINLSILISTAQNTKLFGKIYSEGKENVISATIEVKGQKKYTQPNVDGEYEIYLQPGSYTILVNAMGYEVLEEKVTVGEKPVRKNFSLTKKTYNLNDLVVTAKSPIQHIRESAYNVVAIDAKALHNTTLDVASVLDRVSGVKVRTDGGVGSGMSLSMNGFSGRHVKLFMDGVPMDGFGNEFNLNNIPIGMIERIEVYKGVVPVEFGADALGGVINLVTNNHSQSTRKMNLNASVAVGSFDTYKSEVNFAKTLVSGFTVQLNAFHAFSNNSYKVFIQPKNQEGKWYKHFNDRYNSGTGSIKLGFVNKPFADRLFVGFTYGQGRKGIQNGTTMNYVFGKRHQHSETIMPNFEYAKKNIFTRGLNIKMTGNYNLGYVQNIDTASYSFDWSGKATKKRSKGESGGNPTMTKNYNNNGSLTFNTSYRLNSKHRFDLNNVFTTFNRKTKDPLAKNETESESNSEKKRKSLKNIMGLSYLYTMNRNFNISGFGKYYWTKHTYINDTRNSSVWGYGTALTYSLFDMQLKGSYERTHRLPSANELFGDGALEWANFNLKPEKGDNFNIGLSGSRTFGNKHNVYFDVNYNYRYISDYIQRNVFGEGARASVENYGKVLSTGVNGELRYGYKNLLTVGGNITVQNVKNNEKYRQGSNKVPSSTYKLRMPNVPYWFGNADAGFFIRNLGVKGNDLYIGYNLHYMHEFYYDWSIYGEKETKDLVPNQFSHDVSVSYAFMQKHFNISGELNNFTNTKLYDNYYIQKPGRNFMVKLRYIY